MLSTSSSSPLLTPLLNLHATWSWKRASLMRVLWLARKPLQQRTATEMSPCQPPHPACTLSSLCSVMQCTSGQCPALQALQSRKSTGCLPVHRDLDALNDARSVSLLQAIFDTGK
jgi:hypothetical protein